MARSITSSCMLVCLFIILPTTILAHGGGGGGASTNFAQMFTVKEACGKDPVPEDPSQIDSWFDKQITPLENRKGKLLLNLTEAEASPKIIKVRQDGSGDFKTVSEAIKTIPENNKVRTIIDIGPGEYTEKIHVTRYQHFVTFLGDAKNMPTLEFGGTALKYGTLDSATVGVDSEFFVASNIIFKNTAPRPNGGTGEQAVAMRISGDKATFYNCKFIGFQDTLCDDGKDRHFFKDCYIEGTVDFIFGSGISIYLRCEIHVIPGNDVTIITAQSGETAGDPGTYDFLHCKITGKGQTAYLGRAWRDAPTVVFAYTEMSDVVRPEGWSDNNKAEAQKTVQFGEYKNKGQGADAKQRAKFHAQLTDKEVEQFLSLEYIQASQWLLPPPTCGGGGGGGGGNSGHSKKEL